MSSSAGATTPLGEVVQVYLDRLDAAPSTVRQRRWALRDLQAFADDRAGPGGSTAGHALEARTLQDWLASRADSTVSAQRARASAARALAAFMRDHLAATDLAEARGSLPLPAAPRADRSADRGRALLAATAAGRPRPVLPEVWARFLAHVRLLAATGAGEDTLARLRVAEAAGSNVLGRPVPDGARHAVQAWLLVRSEVVSGLQGSDPGSLWVRVHAGADRRTGHIAPAGLAISARGLRLSFTTVRDALAASGHRVGDVQVRDVRAVAERP